MNDKRDRSSRGPGSGKGPRTGGAGPKAGPGGGPKRGGPKKWAGPKPGAGPRPASARSQGDATSGGGGERVERSGSGQNRAGPNPGGPKKGGASKPGAGSRRDGAGSGEGRSPRGQDGKPRPAGQKAQRPASPRRERRFPDRGAEVQANAGEGERIAKRLARAGVASRRAAEEMIEAGRVSVNGRVISSPALDVHMSDRIEVDGEPIPAIERTRLFLLHKPAGTVTTNSDPEGRKTIFDILPEGLPRLISVGRLDIATEGLLILTNDGGLSRQLELPSTGWLRRYRVRVHGKVDEQALAALKDGVAIDGVYYGSVEASLDRVQGTNAWLSIGLREGKNREVRNILAHLGLEVNRLIRISHGPFQLGELDRGELREIRGAVLREQLGQKLIEESGANFDAPILKPFSCKSQSAGEREEAKPAAGQNRKRQREEKREAALGKLGTRRPEGGPKREGRPAGKPDRKPERKGKPGPGKAGFGKRDDARPQASGGKERDQQRSRGTHVWIAPGARPLSAKQIEEKARETEGRRYAGKPRPARPAKPRKDS